MLINYSILAVMLLVSGLYEQNIRRYTINSMQDGYMFKITRTPWIIVFGYIAFIAAMRTNVNDTSSYIYSFQNLESTWGAFWTQVSSAAIGKDWAFDAVNILFKILISNDYHLWLALYAILESVVFVHVLRKNAVSLLDCCFFFFCSTLYYNYFSMMRQWFAAVMLFGASGFIRDKKLKKYLLVCIIMAQFHSSAYMMIIVYFLVQGQAWSQKQVSIIGLFTIILVFLNPILNSLESTTTGTSYDYVISAMNSDSGSSILRVFIAMVPVILSFMEKDNIKDPMINLCVNMSLLNCLLNLLASFTSGLYVVRFSTYTNMYNMLLYPYLLNIAIRGSNRTIIKMGFYIIYFVFYYYQMCHQGAFFYGSDILGVFN